MRRWPGVALLLAIAALTIAEDCPCASSVADSVGGEIGPWIAPDRRTALDLDFPITHHDGTRAKLSDLRGRPAALTFFYSRCANARKCPAVVSAFAHLHTAVRDAGLGDEVRLALVTFDPAWDTPERLTTMASERGLRPDDVLWLLIPDAAVRETIFPALGASVSFNDDGVTMHAIQLLVFDRSGRLARMYRVALWQKDAVLTDLATLIAEP
ncbi:MAG TPA: SCO family protein [Planctomycetota bacterium]|nr:SCO family protein [Planctomycetota bacterium]